MKLLSLFLTVFLVHLSAATNAQQVNYTAKEGKLKDAFASLKKQTGMVFFFSSEDIAKAKSVSVDIKDKEIHAALDLLLKDQPLEYTIKGNTVFIKAKAPIKATTTADMDNPMPPVDVRGRISDSTGAPLAGASIKVKGSNISTVSDDNGEYVLKGVNNDAVLVISFIGYETKEVKVNNQTQIGVILRMGNKELGDVSIQSYSSGYQQISKERATGSVSTIGSAAVNRRVSTDILNRINGMAPGVLFNGAIPREARIFSADNATVRNLGINIRGVSTLSPNTVGTDPLIVLDNFPYEGDLAGINPNDIESVTILKDAAAASIWGARAGNGVIVLTTKKGRLNSKMKIDFTANFTTIGRPDIFKDQSYLSSSDFIDAEDSLFVKGYFNPDLTNNVTYPFISPVVDILDRQKRGLLSANDATQQLNALRNIDVRNQTYQFSMKPSFNQQYSIGLHGGSNDLAYSLGVGLDKNINANQLIGNGYHRITINALTTYKPFENLELTTAMNYSNSYSAYNNGTGYFGGSVGSKYGILYPYAIIADANGNPQRIAATYRSSYLDSTRKLGFLDWYANPLNDTKAKDDKDYTTDMVLRVGVKYHFTSWLNAEVLYQNEQFDNTYRQYYSTDVYSTRSLINQFTLYDRNTGKLTYQLPNGGILNLINTVWSTNNVRPQLNVNKAFNSDNVLTGIVGAEVKETKTTYTSRTSYGYDDRFGTSINNLDYSRALPMNPAGSNYISVPSGDVQGITSRFISYFANASYAFRQKYILSVSARKDGANIFGVNINNKWKPLWHIGGSYDISKESFYHLSWLPSLKLRATYGYNGNVYNATALAKGFYSVQTRTGALAVTALSPPNPDLRWEKVGNINVGIDFSALKGAISGSFDWYQKKGIDLIEQIQLPGSVGFTSYLGNAAETKTSGLETSLNIRVLAKRVGWNISVIGNYISDKILKYDAPVTTANTFGLGAVPGVVVGKSIFGIFSYKWAGLDPLTGDPQGYLNKQVSKNYAAINNNISPDSLVYSGTGRPKFWGTLRNDFVYKGFSLSVMVSYKFGYVFRKPSITGNWSDVIGIYINQDYTKRWQKPGDELTTNVPSLVYTANINRQQFYQNSEILIDKGDHIRLQDIRLGYDLSHISKNRFLKGVQTYVYLSNLGIIWRANKDNIDPDYYSYSFSGGHVYAAPLQVSFGIQATF